MNSRRTDYLPLPPRVHPRLLQATLQKRFYLSGFEVSLERDFQAYNRRTFAWQMRVTTIMAMALYLAGGLNDYLLFPSGELALIWQIRYSAVLIGIGLWVFSFQITTDQGMQRLFTLILLVGIQATVFIMYHTGNLTEHPYLLAMPIFALVGYVFLRLRFWYATLVGWFTVVAYLGLALLSSGLDLITVGNQAYFLVMANVIGMTGNLLIDTQVRKNYLRAALMQLNANTLKNVNQELYKTAQQDALTGLANRRHLDRYFPTILKEAARHGHPVSVVMLDIDHFKPLNDAHGHPIGDRYLQQVAAALEGVVSREQDLVCRYGGEEFLVVLPHTEAEPAVRLAEAMRQAIAELPPAEPGLPTITLSAGVACRVPDSDVSLAPSRLIKLADDALYEAKRRGRNRVQLAQPVS